MTADKNMYEVQQERIKQAEAERKRVKELLKKFKENDIFRKNLFNPEKDLEVEL